MTDQNLFNIDEPQTKNVESEALGTPEALEETHNEAFRTFKTQNEFQAFLDKALGKRLSKAREQGEELSKLRSIVDSACAHFGVGEDELCGVFDSAPSIEIDNSGDLEESLNSLAEVLSKELSNLTENEDEFYGMQSAEQLICDERFLALLESGFEIKEALDALSLPQILERERERVRGEVIREIRLRGMRPSEDAVSGYGSFSAGLDPRNLTDEQRAQIRERVRRGERVIF